MDQHQGLDISQTQYLQLEDPQFLLPHIFNPFPDPISFIPNLGVILENIMEKITKSTVVENTITTVENTTVGVRKNITNHFMYHPHLLPQPHNLQKLQLYQVHL